MKAFLRILRHAWPYKRFVALNFLFNLLFIISGLFTIVLSMPALNLLFGRESSFGQSSGKGGFNFNSVYSGFLEWLKGEVQNDRLRGLMFICLMLVAAAIVKNISRYMAMYFMVIMRNYSIRDFRQKLYKKTLELPVSFFSNERKGDLISRMSNDMKEIEWAMMNSLEAVFKEPMTILVYLGTLVFISPKLTLYVLMLLPPAVLVIALIGRSLRRKSEKNQRMLGRVISMFEETLGGIKVIKGFVAEKFFGAKYVEADNESTRLNIKVNHRGDLASPLSETLGFMVAAVLLWMGGNMVFSGTLDPEVFLAYFAVFSQLIPPAKAFSQAFYSVQRGMASIDRIEEVLHHPLVVEDPADAPLFPGFHETIEFRDVGFSYGNEPVLSNINLSIRKGQRVALVGHSGAGKSTLADLLARFYDVGSGSILIDGKDIRSYRQKDLRSHMGIVTQESILFNDSIFNNIAFSKENADAAGVENAAKTANAHEFIEQAPEGYLTNVGDRGNKLSGGQKQRVSIARAVFHDPEILILDEATSALDTNSEKLVQSALDHLMTGRTSVVIAHRLSTIRHADLIVVMDHGKIAETGTHDELLANKGIYYSLVQLQELK